MSDCKQEEPPVILCEMCAEDDRKPARKTCMKCEISMCVQHLQAHLTTPVLLQTHPLTEPTTLGGANKCPQHGKMVEYYCLDDRKPARKTCMKCEISMCVQHLQAHLTTPVLLQTHPLTEPTTLGGANKCPQHGKMVEYYCLDDMTCVCVSCAIEDQHRLHNMKTFSTAHKELMETLDTEQKALLLKTDDDNISLEKWEKSATEKLDHSSVRLLDAVKNLRDVTLASLQSSVSARMVSIKTSKSSIQAAQNEKDTFRFLQMYSQVHQDVEKAKTVDLRKGLEPGKDRDKLVGELRQDGEKMVKQATEFWGSLLTLVDPENHQELLPTALDLTFDPQTLGPGMSLSEDNRKVFSNSWMKKNVGSAHMFRIQSTQPFSSFHRWVVSISKAYSWMVGVCDQKNTNDIKDRDIYGLSCEGDQLSSITTEYNDVFEASPSEMRTDEEPKKEKKRNVSFQVIKPPVEDVATKTGWLELIEVIWSFPNSLSFFSRIGKYQKIKITTINIASNSWEMSPFVCLEEEKSQSGVTKSKTDSATALGVKQPLQKIWRCPCGREYTETSDGYTYRGRLYQRNSRTPCSCGIVIGTPNVTEVLCELL
uniref:B box-type domain-containing protein n=1 Tax=Sphaeramia orbicularis TaxID=375764 RepID=A0A672YW96_9TELE